ncbi:hypothetical protein GCM10025883_00560 [Mobilicoccus caccae]|uniref:N-acetyltransferase domain-containing protein n=1 Tax=Mobilicoccus caccae TaxID=1859295 RepID=A0ABQ6ILN1_9MICO|nr:hypothetical protein GCM10025883_00560 [Mobilicoccus caccae]
MPESFPDVVPVLESGQVRLRAHRTDDVPAIVEQCTDPESVRWTTVPRPYSEDDARRWIEMVADGWNTPIATGTGRSSGPTTPAFPASAAPSICARAVKAVPRSGSVCTPTLGGCT